MPVYTPTPDPTLLADIAADVRELTEPFRRKVWRQTHTWTPARNKRVHRWATDVEYPSLLDQLRAAVHPVQIPSRAGRPSRVPSSRPPIAIDPSRRLSEIYVEAGAWLVRLRVPRELAPGDDWWNLMLRYLAEAARRLDPQQTDELAADVRQWWEWAAVQSGHDPVELREGRTQ